MPTTLQLSDGTTTVDMTTDVDVKLTQNYLPVFSTPAGDGTIPGDVTETLPVLIYIVDDDDLASTLQDIAALALQAARYAAGNHQTPVWFSRNMQDESGTIRYLVKSLSFTPDARFAGLFDRRPGICYGRTGVLTITHHPYGERTTAVAASGTNGVSVIGGATDYTNVVGDVPARQYYLHVDNLAAARIYRQFWFGYRSDWRASGDAGDVESLWECEDGTASVDTALGNTVTASPGAGNTEMVCDFDPTTTWAERVTILMSDVTADYAEQIGAYVVLLRAMVTTGAVQVYLRSGINTSVVYRRGPVVEIDATSWTLYNLGTVEWPTRNLHAIPTALFASTYDQRDGVAIWARLKPGESLPISLHMDCLILIPADEYFIHVQSAEITATDEELYVCVAPEDVPEAINVDGTSNWIEITAPVSTIGAGIPVGDGRLFTAIANDNDGTALAFGDTVDIELSTFPRWVFFRGNE